MTRRFVPIILPSALLLAAFAAVGGTRGGWRGARHLRPLLGWVFLALLGASYARASRPVAAHIEYQGMIPHVEKLAGLIGDDDLAIVESRDAGSDVHTLGLPLAYIYGRQVLVLNSAQPDKPTLAEFLEWAHTVRRVLLHRRRRHRPALHRVRRPFDRQRTFPAARVRLARQRVPAVRPAQGVRFRRLRVHAAAAAIRPVVRPRRRHERRPARASFHAKETSSEGRTFRWTRATSYFAVTTLPPDAREVTVTMSNGGRPAGAAPAVVEVYLHGQLLGRATPTGDFEPYSFAIAPALAADGGVPRSGRTEIRQHTLESTRGARQPRRPGPGGHGRSRGGKIAASVTCRGCTSTDPRERMLVGLADRLLAAAAAAAGPFRRRERPARPGRILLLRLERIGDLLMTLPAIAELRQLVPDADIDLVVGSWNSAIARAVPGLSRVITLDAAWLAREGGGLELPALFTATREWRARRYDMAINFEPDVRSNLLLAMARGARGRPATGAAAAARCSTSRSTTTSPSTPRTTRVVLCGIHSGAPARRRRRGAAGWSCPPTRGITPHGSSLVPGHRSSACTRAAAVP